MKALILAAGYATRLYPLTKDLPKPLLKIAGKPIIKHILEKISPLKNIEEIFIVTNSRFFSQFHEWGKIFHFHQKIKIIDDGTKTNEDRLGAVGDIDFVIRKENIDDDLLVIAGDNLFGFSLEDFLKKFNDKKNTIVAFHDLKDKEKVKKRFGVGIISNDRLIDFEEKPEDPKSSMAATACYIFKKADLSKIRKSISSGKADNIGNVVMYLMKESTVVPFVFDEPWFDVGTFESMKEAEDTYKNEN